MMSTIASVLMVAATAVQIGTLKDSDYVVTSANSDYIEVAGLPGPEPRVKLTRRISADSTVTDTFVPDTVIDEIPVVVTNIDTSLVPITDRVLTPLYPPQYLDIESPQGSSLRLPYDLVWPAYGAHTWRDISHKDDAVKVPYFFSISGLGTSLVTLNLYRSPENEYDTHRFDGSGGGGGQAPKINDRIAEAFSSQGTCDLSDLYDMYWENIHFVISAGPQDTSAQSMGTYYQTVTNGWKLVTNSVEIVTNGYVQVTNHYPSVTTRLITNRSLPRLFDGIATNDTLRSSLRYAVELVSPSTNVRVDPAYRTGISIGSIIVDGIGTELFLDPESVIPSASPGSESAIANSSGGPALSVVESDRGSMRYVKLSNGAVLWIRDLDEILVGGDDSYARDGTNSSKLVQNTRTIGAALAERVSKAFLQKRITVDGQEYVVEMKELNGDLVPVYSKEVD